MQDLTEENFSQKLVEKKQDDLRSFKVLKKYFFFFSNMWAMRFAVWFQAWLASLWPETIIRLLCKPQSWHTIINTTRRWQAAHTDTRRVMHGEGRNAASCWQRRVNHMLHRSNSLSDSKRRLLLVFWMFWSSRWLILNPIFMNEDDFKSATSERINLFDRLYVRWFKASTTEKYVQDLNLSAERNERDR